MYNYTVLLGNTTRHTFLYHQGMATTTLIAGATSPPPTPPPWVGQPPPALHIVCVAEGLDWTMVYDYNQGMYLDQHRTRETTKIHSKFITFTTSRAARNEHLADRDTGSGSTRRRRRNKTIPFRWFSAGYFIFLVHCQGTIKQTSQGLSNIIVGKDVLVLCILISHLNVVLLSM